jgi:hypothetical protein
VLLVEHRFDAPTKNLLDRSIADFFSIFLLRLNGPGCVDDANTRLAGQAVVLERFHSVNPNRARVSRESNQHTKSPKGYEIHFLPFDKSFSSCKNVEHQQNCVVSRNLNQRLKWR